MNKKFWDKVHKCKHENISPNYFDVINCPTPYCQGDEYHCLDCGVYITVCHCKYMNGMSGWPDKRKKYEKRQNKSTKRNTHFTR